MTPEVSKALTDTTIYVENNGYRIPKLFLLYQVPMIIKELPKYHKQITLMEQGRVIHSPEHLEKYRDYVIWLTQRMKYLKLHDLITG